MREYTREKEEWKEILEEAVVEEKDEEDLTDKIESVQSGEVVNDPIKENNEGVILIDESQFSEEMDNEAIAKKTKKEFRSRLIMIFILGILIGVAFKTESLKKITIGYNDYLMKIKSQSYDMNKIQADLTKTRSASTQMQDEAVNSDEEIDSAVDDGKQNSQNIESNQPQD
ncbi:MAG: hypothetical protein WAV31_01525 [Candidatus Moraniibacteriota bacterium]